VDPGIESALSTDNRHDRLDPASGFAGYFFKPLDLDALVSALAALPGRSH